MIHKHRGNRRVIRLRKINRKLRLEKSVMYIPPQFISKRPSNMLNKGKIHCSCNLCACKSTKLRKSKYAGSGHIHYNGTRWYSASDKRKFEGVCQKLNDYYEDKAM